MHITFNQIVFLLQGTLWTIALALIGFVGGGVIGMGIALMRVSRSVVVRWMAAVYVQIVQGIPLPVLMFLSYFGLAITGVQVPAVVAAGVSMTIFAAAFLGEIWRGSIQAVPKTQWEAADSLGLTRFQMMVDVILPQAVRLSIPPTVGFMVQIVKNTSYAVVIGFTELTQSGKIVNNVIFQPFVVFTIVGAIYFCLCSPLAHASRRLDLRLRSRGA
jgi:polar amino acid transport system permease protein